MTLVNCMGYNLLRLEATIKLPFLLVITECISFHYFSLRFNLDLNSQQLEETMVHGVARIEYCVLRRHHGFEKEMRWKSVKMVLRNDITCSPLHLANSELLLQQFHLVCRAGLSFFLRVHLCRILSWNLEALAVQF